MLSSACDTLTRHGVRRVLCWFAFPSAPALRSTDSAAVTESGCALFAGFLATMTGLDFPRPDRFKFRGRLYRQISRLLALEDAIDIARDKPQWSVVSAPNEARPPLVTNTR